MLKTIPEADLIIISSVVFLGSKLFVVVRPLLSAVLVAASADYTVPEVGCDAVLEFSLVVVVLHVPRSIDFQRFVSESALVQEEVEKIVTHVGEASAKPGGICILAEQRTVQKWINDRV
jgi:hypothetical protein